MELLIEISKDFIMFSIWEATIFYLFIKKIGNIKCKKIDILLIGVLFCLSNFIIPPTIRQVFCAILIIIYLHFIRKNNIKCCIKYTVNEYLFVIICESMVYCLIINLISNLLFCEIFVKLLEILLIFIFIKMKRRK